jgi:hypothetical protein
MQKYWYHAVKDEKSEVHPRISHAGLKQGVQV